jgi:hypothetical protein
MELKQQLQDYTRAEFFALIDIINKVNVSKQEHDTLIQHFDQVVKHPRGADLLFYPDSPDDFFGYDMAGQAFYHVKKWHNDQGQLAFKDDALPQPRQQPGGPQPSAQERATMESSKNLIKVQKLADKINDSKRSLDSAFAHLEALLLAADAEPIAQLAASADRAALVLTEQKLANVEVALDAVRSGVYGYEFLDLSVKFAKDDAQRSITYGHLDSGLQADILQRMNHASEQYLALRPVFAERQRELHARAQALIDELETHLIRLASAIETDSVKDVNILSARLDDVDVMPRMLTTYSNMADAFDIVLPGLKSGIRSAVSGFAWEATAVEGAQTAKQASILSFQYDNPGRGEPYAFSVPLAEIVPTDGRDWQHLAVSNALIELPFRFTSGMAGLRSGKLFKGLREVTELANIFAVETSRLGALSRVEVCAASWDEDTRTYRLDRQGRPANTVIWTLPASSYLDSRPHRSSRPGYITPVNVPVIEEISSIEELNFDDCIVVFPPESGIEPVYLMFKGAREYAGVAGGVGQALEGNWLQAVAQGADKPIPSLIVDQLRGLVFKRFSLFREAFWKAVAKEPQLAEQFTSADLAAMNAGLAPSIPATSAPQQLERLEIRYVISPANGGGVYDMDNMRIAARLGR